MRADSESIGRRKIINRLGAESKYGDAIGFWATSFEFDSEFLETDFLPNMLNLGAWDDRAWMSRIALEKELAKMDAASVMIDPQGYRGRPRSLRLDVTAAKGGQGNALHAKVLLCLFERAARLIVGSSNLTEQGYRKNRGRFRVHHTQFPSEVPLGPGFRLCNTLACSLSSRVMKSGLPRGLRFVRGDARSRRRLLQSLCSRILANRPPSEGAAKPRPPCPPDLPHAPLLSPLMKDRHLCLRATSDIARELIPAIRDRVFLPHHRIVR